MDNDENEMEKPEVYNVEEEEASVIEQLKVDEVEEDQDSVPSKKQKNDKYGASITSAEKDGHSLQSRKIKGKCG